jgi:hypothetical protein
MTEKNYREESLMNIYKKKILEFIPKILSSGCIGKTDKNKIYISFMTLFNELRPNDPKEIDPKKEDVISSCKLIPGYISYVKIEQDGNVLRKDCVVFNSKILLAEINK